MTEWIRVPRRTLERWHAWWVHEFVDTRFGAIARGHFMALLEAAALPASLLERFGFGDSASQLIATLRFLARISMRLAVEYAKMRTLTPASRT
jgi:hypothetical protein